MLLSTKLIFFFFSLFENVPAVDFFQAFSLWWGSQLVSFSMLFTLYSKKFEKSGKNFQIGLSSMYFWQNI